MSNFKMPIWLKISLMFFAFMITATAIFSSISYNHFERTLLQREEFSNFNETSFLNIEIENKLDDLTKKSLDYAKSFQAGTDLSLRNDDSIIGLEIVDSKTKEKLQKVYDLEYLQKNKLGVENLSLANSGLSFFNGVLFKINDNFASFTFPMAKVDNEIVYHLIVNVKKTFLDKIIKKDTNKSFNIGDLSGTVILNSEYRPLHDRILSYALKSDINDQQKEFIFNKDKYIGNYMKNKKYSYIFLSGLNKSLVLEPAIAVKHKIYYVTGMVLSAAVFLIYLFSMSITKPLTVLTALVEKVGKGDFTVSSSGFFKKRVISDETNILADNIDKMTKGLSERDKFKNVLDKFHGKKVSTELLKRDLSIGGERKDVIVFFSDIRGFTAYTENNPPEEVLSMLNEYLETMVSVIYKHGGIVDKFIGDAIMAAWGVPDKGENDATNALNACLEMRVELEKFNARRALNGKLPINIGMGLHSGQAISGIIGSNEKMEFTIIGDAVNTTSRIESSTKELQTDLLVSEVIHESLKDKYVFEKAESIKVKGKKEPLVLFKVKEIVKSLSKVG